MGIANSISLTRVDQISFLQTEAKKKKFVSFYVSFRRWILMTSFNLKNSVEWGLKCVDFYLWLELSGVGRFTVYPLRIESFFRLCKNKVLVVSFVISKRNFAIEAGPIADMAAGARSADFDAQPDGILIIINQ